MSRRRSSGIDAVAWFAQQSFGRSEPTSPEQANETDRHVIKWQGERIASGRFSEGQVAAMRGIVAEAEARIARRSL